MIITRLPILNTDNGAVLDTDSALILVSHMLAGQAKLVGCYWQTVALDNIYTDDKKLSALMRHYQCTPKETPVVPIEALDRRAPEQQLLLTAATELQAYLANERQHFSVAMDDSFGTPFQRRVWQALATIGYGDTKSYAELAKQVDNPKGYRAVAQANGKNPFSIIVPCHRVISSSGQLGGYTGGLDKKRHLLALEGNRF